MTNEQKRSALSKFGTEILYKKSLLEGLPLISEYAKMIVGAERCSMFMYDVEDNELWTTLADGVERLIIPSDKGLVGETLRVKKALLENDVDSNPAHLQEVDMETGYETLSIITAPIFNANKDVVGVLELLNKDGGFSDEDFKYMKFFAHTLSDFVELINLYEDD